MAALLQGSILAIRGSWNLAQVTRLRVRLCARFVVSGPIPDQHTFFRPPVRLRALGARGVSSKSPRKIREPTDTEYRRLWRGGSDHRHATAMEKMEISDEQIHQETQLVDEEDMFLGKLILSERKALVQTCNLGSMGFQGDRVQEEIDDVISAADEGSSTLGEVGSDMRECWDLWQRIGMSVEKIAKRQHMAETGVFFCLFCCIQNNYTVDWYELCKEAQFTLEVAKRMIPPARKYISQLNGRPAEMDNLRQHLPSDVSDIHFGLFVTMLARGLPDETILDISFQTRDSKPEMEWGDEYADEERFPREATESRLLHWLTEKDGVSLIEIALKFRECNDLHLMRLILKMEKEGKVFWRQGIFRPV